MQFLSTPSARRATSARLWVGHIWPISIHALREEGDGLSTSGRNQSRNFYPRPPRGGRQKGVLTRSVFTLFLSTPSARRATDVLELRTSELKNFYPRPPRGGRRCGQEKQAVGGVISIHALREEGDGPDHPAHAGAGHFYPRPPRGGRHIHDFVSFCIPAFLSTPSARRATRRSCTGYQGQSISIHALREEGDFSQYSFPLDIHDFYPRPPRGGRPKDPDRVRAPWEISIHALREEGDGQSKARCTAWRNFYPRPPRGGRPAEARLLFDYF